MFFTTELTENTEKAKSKQEEKEPVIARLKDRAEAIPDFEI